MQNIQQINSQEIRWCIIIPTFNNEMTLEKVLKETLEICSNIIVVNDGSNDNTAQILKGFSDEIDLITHKKNEGKGKSLRDAFKYAIKKRFDYCITIDSDGQHYPADINLFITAMSKKPDSIIVGARNMMQDGIPRKSSFGNKFSNFWFWVETGISLSDTQTGFRLYPLNKMTNIKFFTKKFEFEIEVLVRMAWQGINITETPIRVKYDKERVSHFRPLKDFGRISVLNTILFSIALVYYIPLRGIYLLFKEKTKKK